MSQTILQELAQQRIGRTLKGKWTLEEVLGIGGMAAVYGATHRNGARVAIKVLHATLASSVELSQRFVREGYLGNMVDHPGVVRVLDDDIDDSDGAAFLVMDRIDGQSLCDHVGDRLLDELDVLDVAKQVLEILVAAHDKGVVHRDLKPDNLIVDEHGTVRLLDFGIARLLEDDGSSYTRTGITFGTPGYMAPEQALGQKERISARTDLYSLGATMFMLLTGEFVQQADTPQELLIRIATRPARGLAEVFEGVSPELANLVDRATKLDPDDRWSSAADMLEEVKRLEIKHGVAPQIDTPRRRLTGRRKAIALGNAKSDLAPTTPATCSIRPLSAMLTTRPSLARNESKKRGRPWVVASLLTACLAVFIVRFPHHAATQSSVSQANAATVSTAEESTTLDSTNNGELHHQSELAIAVPKSDLASDLAPNQAPPYAKADGALALSSSGGKESKPSAQNQKLAPLAKLPAAVGMMQPQSSGKVLLARPTPRTMQ